MNRIAHLRTLALVVAVLLAVAGGAAADPLGGAQDWRARVVPHGVAEPPVGAIPPIAIIETGIDAGHPDMAGGWVRVRRSSPQPDPRDAGAVAAYTEGIAHGTAVAAIIGAPRDGVGLEGVLPGARVWVYGGTETCVDTAAAIRRAVDDGARVINASYGFAQGCREHHDATSYAFGRGALVVAAAGNEGNTRARSQPADDLHVLTVAALTAGDRSAGFSNRNSYIDIAAPGEGVLTAWPQASDTEDGAADGYMLVDGTSFATPMVAAAAAWVMARRPRLSADQVAEILRASARDLTPSGWDIATGWGALDIAAALRARAPVDDRLEPNDDIRWVSGRALFAVDTPLLRRTRRLAFVARLDLLKDPADVLPVWVPAGQRLTVLMSPRRIHADLYVWPSSATVAAGSGHLAAGMRRGFARERVAVVNTGVRGATVYVEVRAVGGGDLAGDYRLSLTRG